jgi:hypothetical protein
VQNENDFDPLFVSGTVYTIVPDGGKLYVGGRFPTDLLIDWIYVVGYPLSEPFWVRAWVGNAQRDVLVQPFERRVLTYLPDNPAGWQVQMGNIGQHYYQWRYNQSP